MRLLRAYADIAARASNYALVVLAETLMTAKRG
jgi:hypothetical protein